MWTTEEYIKGAGRADAVDYSDHVVAELKPDNIRGERAGMSQLRRYANALERLTGEKWTTRLVLYQRP
jgi:RecB family endonuclease NucS